MKHTRPIAQPATVVFSMSLTFGLLAASAADLRPLSTDRPDTTESPKTVDAGSCQFEMELGSWTRDGGDWMEFSLGELNAKVGLDEVTDLQMVLPFYTQVRNGAEGFGDVQIRLKRSLWGNDEGPHALALMPYIKFPTADSGLGNGDFEGGLIVPFGFDGPFGWSCGVMAELDLVSDEDSGGYLVEALVSATASHSVTENTAAFFEIVGIFTPESSDEHEAYFNSGLTWALSETLQLDGGVRVGLSSASTDFSPFFGFSVKF